MTMTALSTYLAPTSLILYVPPVLKATTPKPNFFAMKRAKDRVGKHSEDILSIIYGSLLGDAHMRKTGHGYNLQFFQSGAHADYLLYLHKTFADLHYCNPKIPEIKTRIEEGKHYYYIKFSTVTFASFQSIYEKFYVRRVKVVPKDIESYLTPLAIAVWIMDDGAKSGRGLVLCTNGFTKKENQLLADALHHRYGWKVTLNANGKYYHLRISVKSLPDLVQTVLPFMHPSMLYKLGDHVPKDDLKS